jgi:chromosome partitioning protein
MAEVAPGVKIFPSILESERYKQALNQGKLLSEIGHEDMETSFRSVIELLGTQTKEKR